MRNYEMQKVFLDSINNFSLAKTTSIMLANQENNDECLYAIDSDALEDASSILFSFSIISKIMKSKNLICKQGEYVV
jgi:hypothetical protein